MLLYVKFIFSNRVRKEVAFTQGGKELDMFSLTAYIHAYIIGHYNPTLQSGLRPSFSHHLYCVC